MALVSPQCCTGKKAKFTLVQALRLRTGRTARRGSRGIALLFYDQNTRRGEGSASRPCRSLTPRKTRYQLYRRLGGPHSRSGQVRKISPPPGFDPRTIQPVASRYTDYATRPTHVHNIRNIIRYVFRLSVAIFREIFLTQSNTY